MLLNLCIIVLIHVFTKPCEAVDSESSSTDPCTEIVQSCHECSYWDKHDENHAEKCKITGYIETVKCSGSEHRIQSCPPIATVELAKFWRFEGFMVLTSVISIIFVMLRMKKLDDEHTERIQRQLSAL